MMENLSSEIRKSLAVGLLLIVGMFLWLGVVSPMVVVMNERVSSLDDNLFRVTRLDARAKKGQWLAENMTEAHRGAVDSYYYEAPSPSSAVAQLQADFRTIARRHNVVIANTQSRSEAKIGDVTRIGFHTSFQVTMKNLTGFLSGLKGFERHIELSNVRISASGQQRENVEPRVSVQLDAQAYLLPQEAAP